MNNPPSTLTVYQSQDDHIDDNDRFILCIKEEISDDQCSASDNETSIDLSIYNKDVQVFQPDKTYEKTDCDKAYNQSVKCFICDICNKSFAKKVYLRKHLRIHLADINQKVTCKHCHKIFASSILQAHLRTHLKEKPYICALCDKRFSRIETLRIHSRMHTGATVPCTLCDKRFTQKSNLMLHMRIHTGDKPFACDHCDSTFSRKFYLDRHTSTHTGHKPFACGYCDKTFSRNYYLQRHLSIHTGFKPFECKYCAKAFYRNDQLQKHIVQAHSSAPRPFVCERCNKAFSHNDHLQNHKKYRHLCNKL